MGPGSRVGGPGPVASGYARGMVIELPAEEVWQACRAAGLPTSDWWERIQPTYVQPYLAALGAQVEAVEAALGAPVHRSKQALELGIVDVNSARWRWEGDPGQIRLFLADPADPTRILLEPAGPDDPTPVAARRWIDPPVPVPRELIPLAAALTAARVAPPAAGGPVANLGPCRSAQGSMTTRDSRT